MGRDSKHGCAEAAFRGFWEDCLGFQLDEVR
jgi:hypothetical protein